MGAAGKDEKAEEGEKGKEAAGAAEAREADAAAGERHDALPAPATRIEVQSATDTTTVHTAHHRPHILIQTAPLPDAGSRQCCRPSP